MSAHRTRRASAAMGIAASVAFSGHAWGVQPGVEVGPSVGVPDLPSLAPPVTSVPDVVSTPALPPAPDLPAEPRLPAAPGLPAIAGPPRGGTASGSGSGAAAVTGGATVGSAAPMQAPATAAGAPGGGTAQPRSGSASAFASQSTTRESRRRRLHERRLRRTVARLAGCLYGVSPFQRRVLLLRAGLGRARPLSRAAAARRLDRSPERVRQSEHRGLRRLRATNRFEGCGHDGRAQRAVLVTADPLAAFATGLVSPGSLPSEQPAGDRAGEPGGRGRALGVQADPTPPPSPKKSAGGPTLGDTENGGAEPLVIAALLAATLALGAAALRLARGHAAPSTASGPESVEPAPRADESARRGERDPLDWEPPPPPWSGP
jgi:hypothetical protein